MTLLEFVINIMGLISLYFIISTTYKFNQGKEIDYLTIIFTIISWAFILAILFILITEKINWNYKII